MSTTIQIKRSSTASGVPLATDLAVGELAVNLADKRLFTKQSDGTIIELSTNPTDLDAATLRIDGVEITASATELNSLDGLTATTAELNILDGVTATATEINVLDGITSTTTELNKLDGFTGSTAELNLLDGVTATTAELNVLDGITATTTELNYTDGVTSNIQTQLNGKATSAQGALADSAVQPDDNVTFGTGSFSGAVDVTGTVTADGLTISGSSTGTLNVANFLNTDSSANATANRLGLGISNSSGANYTYIEAKEVGADNFAEMNFYTGISPAKRMTVGTYGDVSFYEDTGTTAKFVWDASAESLGIGTASPLGRLHLQQASDTTIGGLLIGSVDGPSCGISRLNTGAMVIRNNSIDTMYIKSGNVGIGTASPLSRLTVNGDITYPWENSGTYKIGVAPRSSNVFASNSNVLEIHGADATSGSQAMAGGDVKIRGGRGYGTAAGQAGSVYIEAGSRTGEFTVDPGKIIFNTGAIPTERARIDSSGNLLVGTTNTDPAGSNGYGAAIRPSGFASSMTGEGGTALKLNRKANDGSILDFRKDGSTVGSIGSYVGIYPVFSGPTFSVVLGSDDFVPGATDGSANDNTIKLGNTSRRWSVVYSATGSINTSDINEKQDIETLDEAEQRVAKACKGLLRKFRWKDSVAEKGDDARIHFGIMAQDLQQAFADEGLDARRYAMFCVDTWTDEETGEERTRLGVRYSELLAFIISAL